MEQLEYAKLSSEELKLLIDQKRKELNILDDCYQAAKRKEHNEKYISVKVEGCKGCDLERYDNAYCCDHCDGYHWEERLR